MFQCDEEKPPSVPVAAFTLRQPMLSKFFNHPYFKTIVPTRSMRDES